MTDPKKKSGSLVDKIQSIATSKGFVTNNQPRSISSIIASKASQIGSGSSQFLDEVTKLNKARTNPYKSDQEQTILEGISSTISKKYGLSEDDARYFTNKIAEQDAVLGRYDVKTDIEKESKINNQDFSTTLKNKFRPDENILSQDNTTIAQNIDIEGALLKANGFDSFEDLYNKAEEVKLGSGILKENFDLSKKIEEFKQRDGQFAQGVDLAKLSFAKAGYDIENLGLEAKRTVLKGLTDLGVGLDFREQVEGVDKTRDRKSEEIKKLEKELGANEFEQYWSNKFFSAAPSFVNMATGAALMSVPGGQVAGSALLQTGFGLLSASAAGSALREYDEYKKSKGQDPYKTPYERWLVSAGSAATEYLTERIPMGRFLGKSIKSNLAKGTLKQRVKLSPEQNADVAKHVLRDFSSKSPKKYKELVKRVGEGFAKEGGSEAVAELMQTAISNYYKDHKDKVKGDLLSSMKDAFIVGGFMGGTVGPLSYNTQNKAIKQRRKAQGGVLMTEYKGDAIEIISQNKKKGVVEGYTAMYPDGEVIDVKAEDVNNIYKLSNDQFENLLRGKVDEAAALESTRLEKQNSLKNEIDNFFEQDQSVQVTPDGRRVTIRGFYEKRPVSVLDIKGQNATIRFDDVPEDGSGQNKTFVKAKKIEDLKEISQDDQYVLSGVDYIPKDPYQVPHSGQELMHPVHGPGRIISHDIASDQTTVQFIETTQEENSKGQMVTEELPITLEVSRKELDLYRNLYDQNKTEEVVDPVQADIEEKIEVEEPSLFNERGEVDLNQNVVQEKENEENTDKETDDKEARGEDLEVEEQEGKTNVSESQKGVLNDSEGENRLSKDDRGDDGQKDRGTEAGNILGDDTKQEIDEPLQKTVNQEEEASSEEVRVQDDRSGDSRNEGNVVGSITLSKNRTNPNINLNNDTKTEQSSEAEDTASQEPKVQEPSKGDRTEDISDEKPTRRGRNPQKSRKQVQPTDTGGDKRNPGDQQLEIEQSQEKGKQNTGNRDKKVGQLIDQFIKSYEANPIVNPFQGLQGMNVPTKELKSVVNALKTGKQTVRANSVRKQFDEYVSQGYVPFTQGRGGFQSIEQAGVDDVIASMKEANNSAGGPVLEKSPQQEYSFQKVTKNLKKVRPDLKDADTTNITDNYLNPYNQKSKSDIELASQNVISKFKGKNLPKVEVFESDLDLKMNFPQYEITPDGVAGVFDNDRIIIVASNPKFRNKKGEIDQREVEDTIIHEMVGHYGLRGSLDALGGDKTKLFNILDDVISGMNKGRLDAISNRYTGKDFGSLKNNSDQYYEVLEEYVAHEVQLNNLDGRAKRNGVTKKVLDYFKELLEKIGITLPDSKLREIISNARKFVESEEGVFTSRQPSPLQQRVNNDSDAMKDRGELPVAFQKAPPIDSKAFKDWFGDSKMVTFGNQPNIYYHQTKKENKDPIMDEGFDLSKIGARRGDNLMPDGVFFKLTDIDIGVGARGDEAVQIPVFLSIKNPLRLENRNELSRHLKGKAKELSENVDKFDKDKSKEFDEKKLAYREERAKGEEQRLQARKIVDDFIDNWGNEIDKLAGEARAEITKQLKKEGYDGLVIRRDEGSFGRTVKTIVAFSPNQAKSATENIGTYDPNNPGLRFQKTYSELKEPVRNQLKEPLKLSFVPTSELANKKVPLSNVFTDVTDSTRVRANKAQDLLKDKYKQYKKLNDCLNA